MLPFGLQPISTGWTGFAIALVVEIVLLGLPCVVMAGRSGREWVGRVADPEAAARLDWSEWIGFAGIGLTFPGLGLLALARLVRASRPGAWGRRQLALAWLCVGVGAFGFLFFAFFYVLPFTGPVRSLGLANLAVGVVAMPIVGLALTAARRIGAGAEAGGAPRGTA
jgi:hypothetical protein